jgi:hypothetical protein
MYKRTGVTFLFFQPVWCITKPYPQRSRASAYITIQASHAPAIPIESSGQIA